MRFVPTDKALGWTMDQRFDIARRHLIKAASEADARGWTETCHALRIALLQIDHAKESAND